MQRARQSAKGWAMFLAFVRLLAHASYLESQWLVIKGYFKCCVLLHLGYSRTVAYHFELFGFPGKPEGSEAGEELEEPRQASESPRAIVSILPGTSWGMREGVIGTVFGITWRFL